MTNWSSSSSKNPLVPKEEIFDYDFPSQSALPTNFRVNVASSSGTNVTSTLIGMGFQSSLVNKVIQEKGQDDFDLLLDTLVTYTEGPQRSNSESSDSLDCLFGDDDNGISSPEISTSVQPKKEPEITYEVNDSKRASLLLMKFSLEEINFAVNRLGEDAPIDRLVDSIVSSQIAKRLEQVAQDNTADDRKVKNKEVISNEILFGTMDKTLRLLEMGFSETQVSWAIEKCGSALPVSELADSIITGQAPIKKSIAAATNSRPLQPDGLIDPVKAETESPYTDSVPQQMGVNINRNLLRKRPKQEEQAHDSFVTGPPLGLVEREANNRKGKKPKPKYTDASELFPDLDFYEEKFEPDLDQYGIPKSVNIKPRKPLTGNIAKPPYFLYGNFGNVSHESWVKISNFLYNVEPEFVDTRYFSALSRKEGYVHNLPTEDRFEAEPEPPKTIKDAIPQAKKWWPTWDQRSYLDLVSSDVNGVSQLCDRLGRTLTNSKGLVSSEQQRNILHHCRSQNLMWVGRNKLGPIDPESLELILGYPLNHTDACSSLAERLQCLKYCFQTHTLGYHLSVLKSMYAGGLTLLTIFDGIGGAEIALDRLGIRLKAVVAVESSETKRKIVKRWWERSRQRGELVQIESIQKLTSSRLTSLVERFGCFDVVICQNPCTNALREDGSISDFDLSHFCEFVRIAQRVRGVADKTR